MAKKKRGGSSDEESEEEEEESDFSPSEEEEEDDDDDGSDDDFVPSSNKKKKKAPQTKKVAAPKKSKAPAKPKTAKPKAVAVKKEADKKKKASTTTTPKAAKKKGTGGGGGGSSGKNKKKAAGAKQPKKRRKARDSDGDDDEDDDNDDGYRGGDSDDGSLEYRKGDDDVSEDDDDDDADDEEKAAKKKTKSKKQAAGGGGAGKKRGGGGSKTKHEVDKVLEEVRKLILEQSKKSQVPVSLKDLGITNVREVVDMSPGGVMFEIEKLALEIAKSIIKGEAFSYTVPTRSSGNQLYIPELDRIVLSDKVAQRSFVKHKEVRKTAITTRVIQLVHEVLDKGIHITKRDMFYTDVKLFKKQKQSDVVLEDVACMLGCPRSCLNVVASEKFEEDGDPIDCTRMGVGGKAIPPYIDKITNVQSDAKFILLIEKEAAFLRLAEDRFYNKFPCIVITGKGQPDVATRLFLKKLKADLKIPILGLFDSDPWGLHILTTYMSGSKSMSYDSASLTAGEIKWLGVRPSDLDRYKLPEQCRLDMEPHDIRKGEQLLKEDFVQKNPEWVKELELMMKTKKKAEIQALSAFGFQFITEQYLPQKLTKGDWI